MRIESYRAFWPIYLREHRRASTRALHYVGTAGAIALVVVGLVAGELVLIAGAALFAYGFAWIGHALLERNWPATLRHPVWSLISDLRMLACFVTGRLRGELRKHGIAPDG